MLGELDEEELFIKTVRASGGVQQHNSRCCRCLRNSRR